MLKYITVVKLKLAVYKKQNINNELDVHPSKLQEIILISPQFWEFFSFSENYVTMTKTENYFVFIVL